VKDGLDISLEVAIESAQKGELARAEQMLQMLLERDPSVARVHNALGVVRLQMGKPGAAEASLLRCLQLAPDDPRAHINLGKLYCGSERWPAAEEHFRRAILLDAGSSMASFNLAMLLLQQGRAAEARDEFSRAVALDPQDAEAQLRLATLLIEDLQFEEAERRLRDAIRLRPDLAEAHNNLALILLETGRLQEARDAYREAVRISPGYLRAWSNFVMCGQYEPGASDDELLVRARQAGCAAQAAATRFAVSPAPARPRRKLGIVSGDLHLHPVGLLLLPVLRELHREGVKVALYSNSRIDDPVSEELRRHAEWINIAPMSDEEVWSRIRSDGPDTLIDLAGHTGNNRLAVFAARAAPLQITWLGYFATTGTPNMDYAVMDPWHAPPGSERQFSEKILRLPHTRFCFRPIDDAPEVASAPPVARRGTVTFGSFNNVAKVNEQVIDAWSRVLLDVPGSRMVLKWRTLANAEYRESMARRFEQAGVDSKRIEMHGYSDYGALLGQYADIDVALDTFPFTGGQTSFDAHWMGVPVVSLAGHRPVSRQTLCILGNLGLEELAADSEDGYVERAVALAHDVRRLRELRFSLRQRMMSSPLMRAPEFTQALLRALRGAGSTV
jgi:predicted O-linked N-acetylglucosamine transferase (SPINDLY family)